jgi:3-dehydroquinate dehydratase-2
VLNGPNLGALGAREPDVYGTASYDDLVKCCTEAAEATGHVAVVRQTDDESELISWVRAAADAGQPIVLNPAAFTHYSYALRDAVSAAHAAGVPVVEVHLTNPSARERFRHNSVIAGVATGTVAGFGLDSYRLAIRVVTGNA